MDSSFRLLYFKGCSTLLGQVCALFRLVQLQEAEAGERYFVNFLGLMEEAWVTIAAEAFAIINFFLDF